MGSNVFEGNVLPGVESIRRTIRLQSPIAMAGNEMHMVIFDLRNSLKSDVRFTCALKVSYCPF